jgi:small ubiquitin-related modifier
MRVYYWNEEKARKVLKAYRQFLFLKKHYGDWDATMLSPSLLVDQMWHQHILDVVNYCHDMMLLCGRLIGHNPDGAADAEGKIARDRRTREGLDRHFEGEYEKEIWGIVERGGRVSPDESHAKTIITIRVRDQSGEETFFKLHKSTKLGKVFNAYAHRKGVGACELTFLLDGSHIWPDATPKMLELEDQDQIDVILEQRGC